MYGEVAPYILSTKKEKHVEFESQPDIFSDICFESDTVIAPGSKLEGSEIAITSDNVSNNVSTESTSHPSLVESSDKVIPEDTSPIINRQEHID